MTNIFIVLVLIGIVGIITQAALYLFLHYYFKVMDNMLTPNEEIIESLHSFRCNNITIITNKDKGE